MKILLWIAFTLLTIVVVWLYVQNNHVAPTKIIMEYWYYYLAHIILAIIIVLISIKESKDEEI